MKGRSLFGFTVGLVILSPGSLSRPQSATAAPAPIFRPLIRDIQNKLTRNLVFRLPSNLPASATRWGNPKIEFRVDSDSATLGIKYVGCERDYPPGGRGYAINCIPFSVSSSTLSSQKYRERPKGNVFKLNNNLQAYHFQGDGFSIISWIQDGIYFSIYSPSVSYNELIQVARSMVNEPPIYDIATANSRMAARRSPANGRQTATGRSPATGGQMATGGSQNTERSLIVAANSPSISGVTVEFGEFTKEPNKRRSTYAFMVDRVNYKDLSDGSIVLSCVVWNLGFGDGVMEVRNARGELVEVRGIDGMRNPTSVVSFPIEYAQRLWEFVNEPKPDGLGFLGDPTSSFVGTSKKTEIKNIVIPPGGALRLTKNGENAVKYNLAKGVMDILFDKGLPKIFENNSYKVRLLSAIYLKIQQERIGSLAKDGAFITWQDTTRAFATGSWIDEETRDKLAEIGINVLAEELPKYALERVEQQALQQAQRLIAKKVSFWIEATEAFTKNSNFVMQWYDLSMAQRVDPKKSEIIFITQEGN
jgi:hypothetical protein